jgi:FMN reductase
MNDKNLNNPKTEVKVLVIATSLNPKSKSQVLARELYRRLTLKNIKSELVDLREKELPLAGSAAGWSHPLVSELTEKTAQSTHILFAVPVYNYDVNAAAKNFVELVGSDGFENKTVGFICTAGGRGSYMSVLSLANSLMLDFRCWIVPRFLYVDSDFDINNLDHKLEERMEGLLGSLLE